jgi:hypothetical protein
MDARELLHQFDAAGITVVAEAGNLIVRPASTLTTAHRQALRAAKQELLLLLAPLWVTAAAWRSSRSAPPSWSSTAA